MRTYPAAQTLGFLDVELRYLWRWRNAAAIGLIKLSCNLARCEPTRLLPRGPVVRLKLRPRTAA